MLELPAIRPIIPRRPLTGAGGRCPSVYNHLGTIRVPETSQGSFLIMRVAILSRLLRWMPLCLPLLIVGCDDDSDISSRGIVDIIFAVGDVVLAIIDAVS